MTAKKSPSKASKNRPTSASGNPGADPARRQACIDNAGEESMLFTDGHYNAIIGVADRVGDDVIVYDIKKIIRRLRQRDGMSNEDAEEFFAYNIALVHIDEIKPFFVRIIDRKNQ